MYPRCVGSILLAMTCLCVAMVLGKSEINITEHFGSKICERLCNEMANCPTRWLKNVRAVVESKLGCQLNANTLNSARNSLQCRRRWSQQSKQEMKTRLLILSNDIRRHNVKAQLLYLNNNTVVPYPHKFNGLVTAVAYISALRTLVIGTTRELYFAPLDSEKKTITRKHIRGIAVDDIKQLVFLMSYSYHPKREFCLRLSVVKTNGKNMKSFKNGKMVLACSLAADPKRSVIYVVARRSHIDMFTYELVFLKTVAKGYMACSSCVDKEEDVMYYVKGNKATIYKMFLSNHSSTIMMKVGLKVFDFYVLRQIVYVSPTYHRDKLVIYGNGTRTTVKIGLRHEFKKLCPVP